MDRAWIVVADTGRHDHMVIVAAPAFLGVLRAHLPDVPY